MFTNLLLIGPAARSVWQGLASEPTIAADVLDILLETIGHDVELGGNSLAAAAALTVMFETQEMEMVCREEVGRVGAALLLLLAKRVANTSSTQEIAVCLGSIQVKYSIVGDYYKLTV